MSWEDQGRQEHGWLGDGTSDKAKDSGGTNDAALFAPGFIAARMEAAIHGSVGALPPKSRTHPAARPNAAAVDRLTGLMSEWNRAATLDPARFAAYFFNRDAGDPVVEKLRDASTTAASARSHDDLRNAATDLVAAQQDVGLDRWSRFIATAEEYANKPLAFGTAATIGAETILKQLGRLNPVATTRAQPIEGEEENRGLVEELTDPLAPVRIAAYHSTVARIRQLDPRYAVVSRPNSTPSQEALKQCSKDAARDPPGGCISYRGGPRPW